MVRIKAIVCGLAFFLPGMISAQVNDGYGEYLLVPAGPFKMGDNFNVGNARERPVHIVDLDAFYIGKFLVTNAEYKKFYDDGYDDPRFWPNGKVIPKSLPSLWMSKPFHGGGIPGNENFPAVGITWDQATAYGNWLSARTRKKYRLPTEAEWEKAARGTDQRRFPWGNEIDASYVNMFESGGPYDAFTSPVGFYDGKEHNGYRTHNNASPYGAYDMSGDLMQWCQDWYSRNYYSFSPLKNPKGPETGAYRVLRGGMIRFDAPDMRSSIRHSGYASHPTSHYIGFRCVREP